MAQGYLQVDVVSDANSFPVQDADIVVTRTEEPDEIIEKTRTNSSGQTENLPLNAPPLELTGGDGTSICRIHDPNHSIGICAICCFRNGGSCGRNGDPGDSFAASFECSGWRADRDRDDSGSHTLW